MGEFWRIRLGCMIHVCIILQNSAILLPKHTMSFIFPRQYVSFILSISLSTLHICSLFTLAIVVKSYCGFNSHLETLNLWLLLILENCDHYFWKHFVAISFSLLSHWDSKSFICYFHIVKYPPNWCSISFSMLSL